MSKKYTKLVGLLKELFQLDQPDLDFGLYRIMHARSREITQFLDKDLLPQVREAFEQYQPADKASLQAELARAIEQAHALGADPETIPKVIELRTKLDNVAVDIDTLEGEVYDHLYSFFRRYYSEGDFLAKPVYKPGVYAIPYEGEEVKLHWANHDQYYIKTSEYLRDYAFRLRPDDEEKPMRVHFRLVDASEGEHGNIKPSGDKDRVFVLAPGGESGQDFIVEENSELKIGFECRPAEITDWPEGSREGKRNPPIQKDLIGFATERVLAIDNNDLKEWIDELSSPHVRADGETAGYSRLEVHLKRYTARNTFDYFIHKDLGAFLRRELDFYIKNEVMHLDDIENETAPRVEQFLSKIKVIRSIASKIIDFLAQLEDFQKKLWLKKKFVVETNYCITLDRIPEEFYPDIAANVAQREEWVRLFAIDEIGADLIQPGYSEPLTVEFLRAHPALVLDSRHFEDDFTERLIEATDNLEEQTDGVLVHGENYQALNLLRECYSEGIKCIYIDPPYNTDAGPILYKNGYRNSSWMSLIENRLVKAKPLLSEEGVFCVTIDDYQVHELIGICNELFGRSNQLGLAVIRNNPSGRSTVKGFSVCHEYAYFYQNTEWATISRLPRSEKQLMRFTYEDGIQVDWRNFRKDGGAVTHRAARPKQFYPIYVKPAEKTLRIPNMAWDNSRRSWNVLEEASESEIVIWPIDEDGRERVWSLNRTSALERLQDLEVRIDKKGEIQIYRKHIPSEGVLPRSWWDKKTYAAREYGSAALTNLFGESAAFSFAKSPFAVQDCIWISGLDKESNDYVLDFFAGSGTTSHATINLNREDGGRRRFILVEIGDYFDTVLLPRIKKVVFTPEWKKGKPTRMATEQEVERSPSLIKIIRLESYEDTLNNLEILPSGQQTLLSFAETQSKNGFKEEYMLRYMLDVETRGSQSLLNIEAFTDPASYTLKIKRPGSDESREMNIDLLETFNYLIGLTVQHIAAPQTFSAEFERDSENRLRLKDGLTQDKAGAWWFRTVTGVMPDGRTALVIWRKRPGGETTEGIEQDNLILNEWFSKQLRPSKGSAFDLIYVNGDSNLENLKMQEDLWKVRLIEDDFHRSMFDTREL